MKPYKRLFEIPCMNEIHHIGLNDEDCLHLLDHDVEEEETLHALGENTSHCFHLLLRLERRPTHELMIAAAGGWYDVAELCLHCGGDPREKNNWAMRLADNNGHKALSGLLLRHITKLNALDMARMGWREKP